MVQTQSAAMHFRIEAAHRFVIFKTDRRHLAAPDIGDKAAIVMPEILQSCAGTLYSLGDQDQGPV